MSDSTQPRVNFLPHPFGGMVAAKEDIERVIGGHRSIDPAVFNLDVCGSRMLVIRDEPDATYGESKIIIPETARKDPVGAGWVVAVGSEVGVGTSPHPHGIRLEQPFEILGHRIVFGLWSGRELIVGPRDGGFETEFWMLTDRDVLAVDWNE